MDFREIDVSAAAQLHSDGGATFVDIRDPSSFASGHIPGAVHVSDQNVGAFLADVDRTKPVVVYCYHGNSSKGGAAHFSEQGLDAMSMMGGFAAWHGEGQATDTQTQGGGMTTPTITITDEAASKLKEFMAGEGAETRVRLTLDGPRFGLALDEARAGDVSVESAGVQVVVAANVAKPIDGVRVGWSNEAGGFTIDGGSPPPAPGAQSRDEMRKEIEDLVKNNKIAIFMKGTADAPMCGFSARATQILQSLGRPFADKNALSQPEYRYVLSEFSDWPTLPQVFVGGKLIGGSDIVMQMHESGDLKKVVEDAFAE